MPAIPPLPLVVVAIALVRMIDLVRLPWAKAGNRRSNQHSVIYNRTVVRTVFTEGR